MKAYYYGCWRRPGHYLWLPGTGGYPYRARHDEELRLLGVTRHPRDSEPGIIPWSYGLDGGILQRHRPVAYGEAVVEQRDGWTAISFWDRSVDTRPGSNSTFAFDALLTPEEALAAAREAFPPIFDRFTFEVVLASTVMIPTQGGSR